MLATKSASLLGVQSTLDHDKRLLTLRRLHLPGSRALYQTPEVVAQGGAKCMHCGPPLATYRQPSRMRRQNLRNVIETERDT